MGQYNLKTISIYKETSLCDSDLKWAQTFKANNRAVQQEKVLYLGFLQFNKQVWKQVNWKRPNIYTFWNKCYRPHRFVLCASSFAQFKRFFSDAKALYSKHWIGWLSNSGSLIILLLKMKTSLINVIRGIFDELWASMRLHHMAHKQTDSTKTKNEIDATTGEQTDNITEKDESEL